jgi:hypothetical protein
MAQDVHPVIWRLMFLCFMFLERDIDHIDRTSKKGPSLEATGAACQWG